MRVFLTLVPRSNENKSCMRVGKLGKLNESFHNSGAPIKRNRSYMRVDES
jgi:hypothetical protein